METIIKSGKPIEEEVVRCVVVSHDNKATPKIFLVSGGFPFQKSGRSVGKVFFWPQIFFSDVHVCSDYLYTVLSGYCTTLTSRFVFLWFAVIIMLAVKNTVVLKLYMNHTNKYVYKYATKNGAWARLQR